jgi:hypothetical protein
MDEVLSRPYDPDVLGLVPRSDEVLEIDPLLPPDKLDHFMLDGQQFRGHDVTLVWDAPGDEEYYGDGRSGFDTTWTESAWHRPQD